MRNAFKSLLLAFTTLIAGTVAYAQVTTSSLSGIITDEKGETVIGAAVVATHTPSGTVYGGITNTDGRYYINGMRAGGPYSIEISNLGYQSVIFKDVTLQLGENFVLDAWMAEATEQLTEAVVVADDSRFRRERNGALAPWLNRLNARVAHDWYFQIAGKKQTIEVGLDFKNIGNLFNSNWGVYKQMSSNTILQYKDGAYTFIKPEWKPYNNLASTWQVLLSARWAF